MSQFDKRIKVNTVIENHLPGFVTSDFPNAIEFFKQYYISQEFQGGPSDLIQNFDQYIKVDNLVPEVVVGITSITTAIDSSDATISVPSTKGFPSEYGLLKIDNEIISYTGITSTSFTGCIRGFSGVTGYNVGVSSSLIDVNREKLTFEDTLADNHVNGSTVQNLSVLFIQEFYKKLKKTFLPGFEDVNFTSDLDVGNFVKFARSFYQSKGIEESVKILFKVLYGVESTIIDLESNLIKPSGSEFVRREVIVVELITENGEPQNLVGQTIYKSDDLETNASVSEVEIFNREGKTYYKISLFVGYSDRDLIQGIFKVNPNTKVLNDISAGSSIISVDSTVGFGTTGTIVSGVNTIDYKSKSINQFFECSGITNQINTADDIRSNTNIFGYENGDSSKKIELRITGVLNKLVVDDNVTLVNEGENIFVKNLGQKIFNNGITYKEKFANSWIYNTSSRFKVDILASGGGATIQLDTLIDKSSIKVGDEFQVLRRNQQTVDGTFNVSSVDINLNQITVTNLGFTPVQGQEYDIRRVIEKATSTNLEIREGNESIVSNVLNVYTDGDTNGYVASNSLPEFNIDDDVIKETLVGLANTSFKFSFDRDSQDNITGLYNFLEFHFDTNRDIKFIQGDAVVYNSTKDPNSTNSEASEVPPGLNDGTIYYVDPQPASVGSNISKLALYSSRAQIGTASTVQVGLGVSEKDLHTFTLLRQHGKKISANKILRRIPLSQGLFDSSTGDENITDIGILKNGVEVRSPVSEDFIEYGSLSSINLINGGEDYDIINPPKILIETGIGNTAYAEPVITGSVKHVFIDPQEFDVKSIKSVSLTGANGDGCELEAVIGARFRELTFDSRDLIFGGSIDIENETITFNTEHNLETGQIVYYQNNGNASIGIGPAFDSSNTITGSLANGDPYFVRFVNPTTITIYNTQNDALSGINTVGLSTDTAASGIHILRTETKNTVNSIKVKNPGKGYEYRNLIVNPSGISTSFDTINFKNHGFKHGDLVNYLPTIGLGTTLPQSIQGLTTTSSYYVIKVDDNSFKLSNAGVGGTSTSDFDRLKFANLTSTGTGYQTFKYPDIKVNLEVVYSGTVTGTFNITPVVTGSFTDVYLYEKGTDYGSKILNNTINPNVTIQSGKLASVSPIIQNGKVVDVVVADQGGEYNSSPDIQIKSTGKGVGASVRPVIENGKLIDVIVVNSGIGYSARSTSAEVVPRGIRGVFDTSVRSLQLNDQFREGDSILVPRSDFLSYNVIGVNQNLLENLESDTFDTLNNGEFDKPTKHSSIIGWAYDGNPIYGPFGYSEPNNISSTIRIIKSSYTKDTSKVENRPSGFDAGFFIDDYIFDNSGDLDIHNGRFCKTPEFPNGIYAYFATVEENLNGKIIGTYPYFIGKTFRLPLIQDNLKLDHDFDFNSSNLIRNTYPHNVGEKFADNDFLAESNEFIRQISQVQSVSKGEIEDLTILNSGSGYRVGDLTSFDNTDTNGSGFSAEVSELVGLGVSSIETKLDRFEDLIFTWFDEKTVTAGISTYIELNDKDYVFVSGLSTSIQNLTDSFSIGVSTSLVALGKSMNFVANGNVAIEDIFVNKLPDNILTGNSVRIGSGNTSNVEVVTVLNVYDQQKIIRTLRGPGIAHTFGSNVDLLNNRISIPVKTKRFDSQLNDVIYFNAPQSIGLGTDGGSISTNYVIGETVKSVSIPNRQIYLPNHSFVTGQKVKLNVPAVSNRQINVANTDDPSDNAGNFSIPYDSSDTSIDLFVIKKSENYIGLSTVSIGNTSEGLYFKSDGSAVSGINTHLYNLSSQFDQVTGDIDKIVSTVTTNVAAADTTTHNLQNGDIVSINVVPNHTVGIGNTNPIEVNYNAEYEKLLINPINFTNAGIETNRINIENHGFNTGDKVFYVGNAGLGTGSYFVYKVNSRFFQLAETLKDLSANPIKLIELTNNSGGSDQSISPINPQIKVYKNSKIQFGLSTTTLAGFDFNIFYSNGENVFNSSQDSSSFNVGTAGTVGVGTDEYDTIGATLTLQPTASTPPVLYYGITKGGYISTADNEVQNYSQIIFLDSVYNGEYKISDITSETFNFSPKLPEFLTYNDTDCEKIEYSTKSTNVKGGIKKLKILSNGFNYKQLPTFKEVTSAEGVNANLVTTSKNIGKIKNVRVLDIGYEYSADKTLQPEVYIPSILNVDNLDTVTGINIVSGGSDYTTAPNLILFNPVSNQVVDSGSLQADVPNQTISFVQLVAPLNGLDSIQHKIFAVNNSNGIGINSIQSSSGGLVTCFLQTPFNGFVSPQPFAVGDEIYVEGIQRVGEAGGLTVQDGASGGEVLGEGFNSENHNYSFFKVQEYIPGSNTILKFSVAGVTTNPGIAKTFQSGYATIVNKNNYPELIPIQERGVFQQNEPLILNDKNSDLTIVETRDDFIKLDGLEIIKKGDRITGRITGVSAEIVDLKPNLGRFEIDFSNRQEYGWIDNIGKLNDDIQVIPDNDYYQNLSYSVKSPITWDKFSNSVNSIVHPAGLKNFADTFVQSIVKVGIATENDKSVATIILDLVSDDNRVDAINNFDYVLDYNSLGNKSKSVIFSEKKLTNYNKCISNRVLLHDDISGEFSSVGFAANSSIIDEINGKVVNYLIQVVDPDTFDTQLTELVVLTKEDQIILLEKTSDTAGVGLNNIDGNLKLGEFETEITGTNSLLFNPVEKYIKDHDIKILKSSYDDDIAGISTNVVGSINLISANVGIASATTGFNTTTIVEFDKDTFNGLQANIFVQDSVTKEINYNEVILDFDGTNTTLSQIYSDDVSGITTNTVGILTARLENDLVKLQIENNRSTILDSKSSIVGLGTTTAGIGTHRFLTEGQPPEAERSIRFESTFNLGTSSDITYATINKSIDSSIKSLVKVSTGEISAIHQVTAIRDAEDVLVVQYPYVSLGSTSGIGSFTSVISGDDINLRFVPDSEFTDEVKVQAFNQVFYTESDFSNIPATLSYGNVDQNVLLSTYDGLEGERANKTKFDLKYQGTPIYTKTFNPDGVGLEKSTGIFTVSNHFFNTNEQLEYTPDSSFIGVAGTAISIGSTVNTAGITTDILPTTVFAKVISEDKFQLFPTKEDIVSGIAITVTGVGSGNIHKLNMTKKLSKTIIGLDGVVQQPVTFTSLTHTLNVNIGSATTQFALSGIGSISTFDVLKINEEFMKIIEVGFSSTSDGSGEIDDQLNISLGISTIPTVRVQRGSLGIGATPHNNSDIVRVHRGSFNIIDSTVHFIDPPKGNTRSRKTDTELPFVKADFSGRTFTRQDYSTNMLFDDISDNFTGLTTAYTLKVGGANTSAGIEVGNGVVFINGVYQKPFTANSSGNNYEILADTTAGISTIRFTGITSENGQFIVSDSDINQNQIPRGGLIVSLGSTEGLGYAPLVGAKVRAEKNTSGELTGIVGIGTSSGFNIGIQTAVYDNLSGIITVTTNDVHGFALDRPTSVKLKGLEFVCPKTVVGTPTNATYNPATGVLVLTIANHGLVVGDAVILDTGSICFTCTQDSNNSTHCYPRATDPAAGQYLTITNKTTNTFRVNVGASAPGDQYAHTFVSAAANSVKTIGGGGYVGVTTTIFQDHERPLFVVGIVSERSFEVRAGASTIPHTYQGGGHAYEFYEDLTFGSGYRGGTVAIGVTDQAYVHKFVSAGIGSIRQSNFAGNAFTATDAVYTSHTGTLVLTIPSHGLTTSDTVGIDTGGLVFKCSKDNFFSDHPYPRSVSKTSFPNSDPIAGIQTAITATSTDTITLNVGQGGGGGTGAVVEATVGVGGTLSFSIVSAGTSYVNPRLIIPEPIYENLEVVGLSRLGVGATTDTGANLLLNVGVSAASTSVGIGSTLFGIKDFEISRSGYSFKKGDKFKPVGLVTAAHLSAPIQEFELEVLEIFNDKFSAWQFGEIDAIDSIKILQDGSRTRFPLFFNGELLSFEKVLTDPRSALIDLDSVLLVFVNGVLQKPGEAYQFQGGTTFIFTEAPSGESQPGINDHDSVDIYFYKGIDGIDVQIENVSQTIKIGDAIDIFKSEKASGITTSQTNSRIVKDILNTDLVDTDIYQGLGIDEVNEKPIRWTKQKNDLQINGSLVSKARSILEPQVYPTSKIIGDLSETSGIGVVASNSIFVDDAQSFFYEGKYGGSLLPDSVDALITSGEFGEVAKATATIGAGGTISSINITEGGSGYSGAVDIGIEAPIGVEKFVGIGTTATATVTVTNGVVTGADIINPGLGYDQQSSAPQVIIENPKFETERITGISNFEGFIGIITGITKTTRAGGPALRFDFHAVTRNSDSGLTNATANLLAIGYPVYIKDTKVGNGLTSVNSSDTSVVGIGTTFLDNVYVVNAVDYSVGGSKGTITCNVHSNTDSWINSIDEEGFFDPTNTGLTTSLGTINWGRLYGASSGVDVKRSSNPISIGVTGLTVNSGLTTFPTIQRKSYDNIGERGHRSSGSIRAVLS
tara:strand:+ start:2300 stop:15613 length:13314 start_codon:yes stop_codon:yes gene_type:complete